MSRNRVNKLARACRWVGLLASLQSCRPTPGICSAAPVTPTTVSQLELVVTGLNHGPKGHNGLFGGGCTGRDGLQEIADKVWSFDAYTANLMVVSTSAGCQYVDLPGSPGGILTSNNIRLGEMLREHDPSLATTEVSVFGITYGRNWQLLEEKFIEHPPSIKTENPGLAYFLFRNRDTGDSLPIYAVRPECCCEQPIDRCTKDNRDYHELQLKFALDYVDSRAVTANVAPLVVGDYNYRPGQPVLTTAEILLQSSYDIATEKVSCIDWSAYQSQPMLFTPQGGLINIASRKTSGNYYCVKRVMSPVSYRYDSYPSGVPVNKDDVLGVPDSGHNIAVIDLEARDAPTCVLPVSTVLTAGHGVLFTGGELVYPGHPYDLWWNGNYIVPAAGGRSGTMYSVGQIKSLPTHVSIDSDRFTWDNFVPHAGEGFLERIQTPAGVNYALVRITSVASSATGVFGPTVTLDWMYPYSD